MNAKLVGENIKRFRIEAGLKQEELAGMLGVSRQTFNYWENGRGISPKRLVDVATMLGKTMAQMETAYAAPPPRIHVRQHARDEAQIRYALSRLAVKK